MKTSARNQLRGKVSQVIRGVINNRVMIDIGEGVELCALITDAACKELGLDQQPGNEVIVLFKASSIFLVDHNESYDYSARNQLQGEVISIEKGPANAEVVLKLVSGQLLTAVVTRKAADETWIQVGSTTLALIKASHLILAVPR
ncbi:MAG: TOBE domain-containing protein [Marinospirillum sp.]|uniref:TOBE domain-containing protein n=1 Tax=Marinospirillum sp. TaxID=2183934 RepID=UPI0019F7DD76|nr:TOBE domain-containing protein [Marinospirillum sp.]MBE0507983.1 TOBE domain-containing protein [Marinospirillum sp.]